MKDLGQQPPNKLTGTPGDRSTECAARLPLFALRNLARWHDDKLRIARSEKSERDAARHQRLGDFYWGLAEAKATTDGERSPVAPSQSNAAE